MTAETYLSGLIQRYHANPHLARFGQTLSQHQWGCGILLMELYPDCILNLLKAVQTHDAAELHVGDLPYDFKIIHPDIAASHAKVEAEYLEKMGHNYDLTADEKKWLKFVDRLECLMFCQHHLPVLLESAEWVNGANNVFERAADLGVYCQTVQVLEGLKIK